MILYPKHLHKTYKGFATLECFIYKNIQLVKMHFIMKILAHTDESPTIDHLDFLQWYERHHINNTPDRLLAGLSFLSLLPKFLFST